MWEISIQWNHPNGWRSGITESATLEFADENNARRFWEALKHSQPSNVQEAIFTNADGGIVDSLS